MYLAGRELLGRRGAWWAAASLMLLPPLGWYSIRDQSHTVLVTAMTCAAWWLLLRIVRRLRQADFAWLGLVCGLGMLSKYSFALVAGAMLVAALSVPEARRALLARGWWWTPVVGALVVLPHAAWLLHHLHQATAGTIDRMQIQSGGHWGLALDGLLRACRRMLGLWALVALWAFRASWWRAPAAADATEAEGGATAWARRVLWRYLALITLALLVMALGVGVTRFEQHWVIPLLCAAPLAAFATRPQLQDDAAGARRYTGVVMLAALLMLAGAWGRLWYASWYGKDELNHPAAALGVALRDAGYDGRGRIIASDHMLAAMLRTRFPRAPAAACMFMGRQVTDCVAANIEQARRAGIGWLLVSRDDRIEPGWWLSKQQKVQTGAARMPAWWDEARAALSAAPTQAMRVIELPFRMVRDGTPPARYRYIWQPPAQEAASS
jgi:4-amino-4-deoxy-L-arabinose transferase-like glycosyltransferase